MNSSVMRSLLLLGLIVHCLACRAPEGSRNKEQTSIGVKQEQVLEKKPEEAGLTPDQTADLALNYFRQGQFAVALKITDLVLEKVEERSQRGFYYLLKAQCEAALRRYSEAATSATMGQRLSPQSQPLALLRVAYSELAGNRAEQTAAIDHLKRLNPNIPEPVMATTELLKLALHIAYNAWIFWQEYGDDITKMASKAKAIGMEMITAWQEIKTGKSAVVP